MFGRLKKPFYMHSEIRGMSQAMLQQLSEANRNLTSLGRLKALKRFYLEVLVEDPVDGTMFDCAVLNAIEHLERMFHESHGG